MFRCVTSIAVNNSVLLSACFVVSPLTLLMPQFLFSVHSIHCVPSTAINASVFVISMFRCVTSNVINASVFVFCTQCPRANGTPLKLKVNMTPVHGDSVLSCLLVCVFPSSSHLHSQGACQRTTSLLEVRKEIQS